MNTRIWVYCGQANEVIERLRTELEATRTELVEVQRENARLLNDMERMIDFSIEINKDREELEALLRMHPHPTPAGHNSGQSTNIHTRRTLQAVGRGKEKR